MRVPLAAEVVALPQVVTAHTVLAVLAGKILQLTFLSKWIQWTL